MKRPYLAGFESVPLSSKDDFGTWSTEDNSEISDPDECIPGMWELMNTTMTKALEESDPDEFVL